MDGLSPGPRPLALGFPSGPEATVLGSRSNMSSRVVPFRCPALAPCCPLPTATRGVRLLCPRGPGLAPLRAPTTPPCPCGLAGLPVRTGPPGLTPGSVAGCVTRARLALSAPWRPQQLLVGAGFMGCFQWRSSFCPGADSVRGSWLAVAPRSGARGFSLLRCASQGSGRLAPSSLCLKPTERCPSHWCPQTGGCVRGRQGQRPAVGGSELGVEERGAASPSGCGSAAGRTGRGLGAGCAGEASDPAAAPPQCASPTRRSACCAGSSTS